MGQIDPTLEAMNHALVTRARRAPRRTYLGMSAIGNPCARKLWYAVHTDHTEDHDAATLKRFEDGHRGEELMARRLRLVPGVTLLTVDPNTGRQFGFKDHEDRFRGHMDGVIIGLLQAPKTYHVWEHKSVNDKKQGELVKLKALKGEKDALRAWDETYYGQAVLYMDYAGLERHYLTCSTPGERTTISVRTNADPVHAAVLKDKAKRILEANAPLARISNDRTWYQCQWCAFHAVCHA